MFRSISDRGDLCVNIEYRIVFKYDNDIVLYESICSIWRNFICKIYALDNKFEI